jgi:RNA polymerase nonessential primary-like sigma factor
MASFTPDQFIPSIISCHRDEVAVLDRNTQLALLHEVSRGRDAAERLSFGAPADEVRCLNALVRKGKRARDRLIVSNIRLVASIARTAAGRRRTWLTIDDLIQEGSCGLSHAIDKFDPSYGAALSTYATWWIRQAIDRAIANSGLIRVPVHAQDTVAKRRDPQLLQLSWFTSIESLVEAQRVADEAETSTDEVWAPQSERPLLASEQDDYEQVDVAVLSHDALDVLPERQAYIVRRRFGIGCEAATLEAIGQHLGLTRERVRQIESQALDTLRRRLATEAEAFTVAA